MNTSSTGGADALAAVERNLGALDYTSLGGIPYVPRELIFGAVNGAARDLGIWGEYVAAARAGEPGPRGEHLDLLALAARNGDVPAAARPLWRYDVPEVPPGVVAIKGGADPERIFVRVGADWWRQWSSRASCLVGEPWPLREVIEYAPLVECPDPRKAAEG